MQSKAAAARLLDLDLWVLSAAVLLSVVKESFLPYSAGLGLLFCLLRGVSGWRSAAGGPAGGPLQGLLWPVTGLAGMAAVSLWVTPLPETTLLQALRLANGIFYCACVIQWTVTRRRIRWLLGGLLGLTLLLAGSALLLVNWADKFRFLPHLSTLLPESLAAAVAGTVHPNVMGGILAILLGGLCAWTLFCWQSSAWAGRVGLGAAILAAAGVLFLSQSRGALAGLAAALALLTILRFRRGWWVVGLGALLAGGLILLAGPEQVWQKFGLETGGVSTFASRESIWLRAKLILYDFPLSGIGMGTFGEVADTLYPLGTTPLHIPHAHNLYLQIALDLGLPGLAFWLAAWFSVLRSSWKLYRSGELFYRALGAALLCAQAALGTHGLLDATTWDTRPAILVWVIWGLSVAAGNQQNSALD